MNEWEDETLVAIATLGNNKFEVWELPARQRSRVPGRKPTFHRFERAEDYIALNYPATVLKVTVDDFRQEMERREAAYQKHLED